MIFLLFASRLFVNALLIVKFLLHDRTFLESGGFAFLNIKFLYSYEE